MKKKLILLQCFFLAFILLFNLHVKAQEIYRINTFVLNGVTYEINLPNDWHIEQNNGDSSSASAIFIKDNVVQGGIVFQDHLPLHSDIVGQESIITTLGSGTLYGLARSSSEADLLQSAWYEMAAMINNNTGMPYYIYIRSIGANLKRDRDVLLQILQSIRSR